MRSQSIKNEAWLYVLAFLLAFGLRFIQLGASPLTDSEARLALQALHLAQGKPVLLEPQPFYILFTSLIFLITEASNFSARFLPALAGSLFVFVPLLFREKLRPLTAALLAILISFDPGLTALSRQANGTIFALLFLLTAWGMWRNERYTHAGIFAALALLSGPSVWSGILILGLTFIFLRDSLNLQPLSKDNLRTSLTSLAVTLLFAGSLFFTVPNGLSALFRSLPEYLQGWTSPSTYGPGLVFITLLGYEPFALMLAVLAVIRGFRIRGIRPIRLSIWLAVSALLTIFYRQTSELGWAIIPLLILAADELSRVFDLYHDEVVEVAIVAGAVLILLIYVSFNVSAIALNPYDQPTSTTLQVFDETRTLPIGPRNLIVIGAFSVLAICLTLIVYGWSARTARFGVTWSFSLFFIVYALASAWGASGLRLPNGVELWKPDQTPMQADYIIRSVHDLSLFSRGDIESQPVAIVAIDSPALEWALRDHAVENVSVLDPLAGPPIVVTPWMSEELNLGSAYRGQDFSWRMYPQWDILLPPDWVRWLVYRKLPVETETIILWVRDDLFPDARENVVP